VAGLFNKNPSCQIPLIEFSLSAFMDDDAQEKNASLSSVATFQCPGWRKQIVVDPDLQAKTRRSWRGIIVQASSSTAQGDRGTSTDESLDAAVKGNDVCVCVCVCVCVQHTPLECQEALCSQTKTLHSN
jgi:hypothetical protein